MSRQSDPDDAAMWDAFNAFHYWCDTHRFQKLFARADLVRLIVDVPGDIVDAGAYKGTSTIQFAHLLKTYQPNTRSRVVTFDTFDAVFPRVRADEAQSARDHMKSYDVNAYDNLVAALARTGIGDRVEIVRGDIVETLPRYLREHPGFRIALLHCDLDVYPATLATLRAAWDRIVPGGICVFDEYAVGNWGEADAVDEFFATLETPPQLRMLATSPTPTAYCIKDRFTRRAT
jgi:predicted O-methyltransferase YrrM